MPTTTITVVHTKDEDDGDLAELVRASFPGGSIQVVDLSNDLQPGLKDVEGTETVVLLDASGSMVSQEEATIVLRTLRTVREAAPTAPILAAFMEEPASQGTLYLDQRFEEIVVQVLEAGANDYVTSAATGVAGGSELLRHRVRSLLGEHHESGTPHPLPGTRDVPTVVGIPRERRQPVSQIEDPFRTPWLALYDEQSGRLHARQIANELGVSLRALCEALELSPSAVHRAPSAQPYQRALQPVARVLEMLHDSLPDDGVRRAWLNRPRGDLEGASPLAVIMAGEVDAVVSLLEGAQLGLGA
ncbi:hypothetical protein [Gemmatimonas aurantiaca]|uniref:hypothetical protein n=1 Tax=Gemmatimonas aurantiaca TaxID=173480 RepID=UPI00301BE80F